MTDVPDSLAAIAADAPALRAALHGDRAARLSQAARAGLPVPPGLVLGPEDVAQLAGHREPLARAVAWIEATSGAKVGDPDAPLLLALRPADTGAGALTPAVLGLTMTPAVGAALADRLGPGPAEDLRRRHLQAYGAHVLGIDPEAFEDAYYDHLKACGANSEADLDAAGLAGLAAAFEAVLAAEGLSVPDDPLSQIADALRANEARWTGPRADRRREARGLPRDAPLRLILQAQVFGVGPGLSGAGILTLRDEGTGAVTGAGRFLAQAEGEDALMGLRTPAVLSRSERAARGLHEPSLEERAPDVHAALRTLAERLEAALGESLVLGFTLSDGALHLLDLRPARSSSRAALRTAVELAEAGAIDRSEALGRVSPDILDDHLHPSLVADHRADVIGHGLPASPGAASGSLVFSPDAAEQAHSDGQTAILALTETGPEDIRGMHAAAGVLTVRGGMTSHAALVARGLGKPCVVGARDLSLDRSSTVLKTQTGRTFRAGDIVTVDGGRGRVIAGAVPTRPPEITGAFARLLGWADDTRRLAVRANADTAADAAVARRFNAAGIGLCRTEHMFFKRGRITAMQEMILADSADARRAALDQLMPMQRTDFIDLFREMAGRPVTVRLLDPPLHEFLPHGADELADLAAALSMPVERIRTRARALAEFNPMLGRRGCRIGIAYPEIYEMQARAVFEAAVEAGSATGEAVKAEIMIPLVSTVRELELLRERVDAVASAVSTETGAPIRHTVGVMIETPRACLRAGDIAAVADFLSFGTNDLTQMLYGLSRDDAGRFMGDYISQGVFPHDPFHRIDEEGVGEIVTLGIERARAARPDITIGLCGEHGGDPVSVAFCDRAGFDYVSCSPYRLPIARLAAAQARLPGAAT